METELRERLLQLIFPLAIGNGYNSDQALAMAKEAEAFVMKGTLLGPAQAVFDKQSGNVA